MNQRESDFIAAWQAVVDRADRATLLAMFAEDATFYSPAVFKPYRGRAAIVQLLSEVLQLFGHLTYTHSYANPAGGVVMQFETTIPGPDRELHIEGVDIFQLDEEGLIRELKVMIRPLRGLQGVAAAMEARLAQFGAA